MNSLFSERHPTMKCKWCSGDHGFSGQPCAIEIVAALLVGEYMKDREKNPRASVVSEEESQTFAATVEADPALKEASRFTTEKDFFLVHSIKTFLEYLTEFEVDDALLLVHHLIVDIKTAVITKELEHQGDLSEALIFQPMEHVAVKFYERRKKNIANAAATGKLDKQRATEAINAAHMKQLAVEAAYMKQLAAEAGLLENMA